MECQNIKFNYYAEFADSLVFSLNLIFSILLGIVKTVFIYSLVVLLVLVLYVVYKAYWRPNIRIRDHSQLGFDHIKPGPDRAARIAKALSSRNIGTKLPPPYPNGWFAIAESSNLKIGGVLAIDALGQNLCVFRGEDGIARCVDAYCPHLGVHLGIGGKVCGNCIECPFHHWQFDESGKLVKVPGEETVPKGVSVKTWTTVEADGGVWIWYDAEGREPLWEVPEAPEVKSWGFRGKNEYTVSCHIQDVPENSADPGHLTAVHGKSLLYPLVENYPWLRDNIGNHQWSGEWKRDEGHISKLNLIHQYKFMKMTMAHVESNIVLIGPGQVQIRFESMLGPAYLTIWQTPIGPLEQKIIHKVYTPFRSAITGVIMHLSESIMFERDIAIWNNKSFIGGPVYVRADKTIRAFRTWFSQFYSEHSISFRDAQQNTLDW